MPPFERIKLWLVRPTRGDIQGAALRDHVHRGFSATFNLYDHLTAPCVQELQQTRIGDLHGNTFYTQSLKAHPPACRTLSFQDTISCALIIEQIKL